MFAVIDLGSNSFHLLIANYSQQRFTVIDRHSEKVQLAENIFNTGRLKESAMQRGIDCLKRFKKAINQYPVEKLAVVATQAMRQASNADDFSARAKEIGFDIEVIPGEREAALIYRGIVDPLPDSDDKRLIFDIGGASTEVALGCNQTIYVAHSTPLGCVSYRDKFFAEDFNYEQQAPAAKQAATDMLQSVAAKLQSQQWQEVYASSGTAKMLHNIAADNGFSKKVVSLEDLSKIEELIKPYRDPKEMRIKGLKQERQDLLAPGICIMMGLMQTLKIESFRFSAMALREGILDEISNRRVDYILQE